MSLVDGGRELVRDSELEVTPRLFVTSQELEAFGKWAIGREEVVDAVDLGMEDVLEVCAFGEDAANPVAGPLEGAEFYGGEVRKDEDDQFGWKVEEGRRTGLERHSAPQPQRPRTVLAVSAYGCAPRDPMLVRLFLIIVYHKSRFL